MNDSNSKRVRHLQAYRLGGVTAFALNVLCVACSSKVEGGGDTPAFDTALGGASTNSAAGGAGGGPSGTPHGNVPANPSTEQPAAGSDTAIDVGAIQGSAGGSAATNGGAGSSMLAAGGSDMAASGGAGGAAVQLGMPASNECEGGAFFCEDFDGLALGALPPGVNGMEPERSVSVIADAARGQVLGLQAGPGYGNKAGIFLNDFAPPDNSHFGRMFVNVGAFPIADSDHWVLVETTGNGGDQVRPVGGQFQRWAPGADGPSAGDWTDWQQSTVVTVAGAWQCVEWQMNGANGQSDMLLWVDDVQVQPLDRPSFSFPTFNRLWIGWVVYLLGEPSQYDVRIDDIVLSTQRIGCN